MNLTIQKSDLEVKNFDAAIQAMVLKLGAADNLALSSRYSTRTYFEDVIVKKLSQATIDILVSGLKNKDNIYPCDILQQTCSRFTEANWAEIARSKNYALLLKADNREILKDYPDVASILKSTILTRDDADTEHIDDIIQRCTPEELDQYKDYTLTRRQLASYQHCPMFILDHYKDCMDVETLARILERKPFDKRVKIPDLLRRQVYAIQIYIATHRSDYLIAHGANEDYIEDQATRLMKFIVRNKDKVKVTITATMDVA